MNLTVQQRDGTQLRPETTGSYGAESAEVESPSNGSLQQPMVPPIPPLYPATLPSQPPPPNAATGARSQSTSSSGSGERIGGGVGGGAGGGGQVVAGAQGGNPLSPLAQPPQAASQPMTPTGTEPSLLPASQQQQLGSFPFGDPSSLVGGLGMGGPSTSNLPGMAQYAAAMASARLPPGSHFGPRKYPCKLCTNMFESKAELQIHTQVHMREAKPYKCTHCPKSFANSSYLSQHMRIHLGIKPFGPCQYCGRKFTQLSHLQQHLRTHTGEKPYKCRYAGCEKAFSQLSNLQSHSRCHQQDKPFKCNSCYKCFSLEAELLEHIPKHKESKHLKVHICPYCGKSYTQATYLAKHMTKHSDRRDRDIRLREMMREDGGQSLSQNLWATQTPSTASARSETGQICAVHGIPDSCGEAAAAPSVYSFPSSSFQAPSNCSYPAASAPSAASAPDPSAFSRFNALTALAAGASSRPPARSYFPYDAMGKGVVGGVGGVGPAVSATPNTAFPAAPYTSLIRLDDIRQYAGQTPGNAPNAHEQFSSMLNPKRDTY